MCLLLSRRLKYQCYIMVALQELEDVQGKYKNQTKELRDAMAQRKQALAEFTDVHEK